MPPEAFKVGELARRTGLTVRALHHYDEIGLLKPSLHTSSGHRLYTVDDLATLQRILSLRSLGFSLEQVADCLNRDDFAPLKVIRLHLERVEEQIELQVRLRDRLKGLASLLGRAEAVSADDFLRTIEVTKMIENYYTPEQLESLRMRSEAMGAEAAHRGQLDWTELITDFKSMMDDGVEPTDPKLEPLLKRRQALLDSFTGGDPGIATSLKKMWSERGAELNQQFGFDPKVMEYIAKAAGVA